MGILPLDLRRRLAEQRFVSSFRRKFGEEGQSMVEFALVAPMMLALVMGIFMFGIFMNSYLSLTDAVETGAQQLALLRGNADDPCATTVTNVENSAPGLTAGSLKFSIKLGGTGYTTTCNGVGMTTGETAQLTVTYPITLNLFGLGSQSYTLSASTTELVQ